MRHRQIHIVGNNKIASSICGTHAKVCLISVIIAANYLLYRCKYLLGNWVEKIGLVLFSKICK